MKDQSRIDLQCYHNSNLNVSLAGQASGLLNFYDNSYANVYITESG